MAAEKGLFLAVQAANGTVSIEPIGETGTGHVSGAVELPGRGVLLQAEQGLFLAAQSASGKVTIEPIGSADTGHVSGAVGLPGGGVLLQAEKGLFQDVQAANGTVTFEAIGGANTGRIAAAVELPDGRVLIGAERGLFLAIEAKSGKVTLERVGGANAGHVSGAFELPGGGVLVIAENGFFLPVRTANGSETLEAVGGANTGPVSGAFEFPGGGVLVATEKGLFWAVQAANGSVTLKAVGSNDIGRVSGAINIPGKGVILHTQKGSFLAVQAANGNVTLEPVDGPDTGRVSGAFELPGGAALVTAEKGSFLAVQAANGKVTLDPVAGANTGRVTGAVNIPGRGVLLQAEKGLFVAEQAINGAVSLEPIGGADTGSVVGAVEFTGGGVLFQAEKGIFLAVQVPLESAIVDLQNRSTLEGSPPDDKIDRNLDFTIEHACASVLGELSFGVRVTAPDGRSSPVAADRVIVRPMDGRANVSVRMLIGRTGLWKFQFVSSQGGKEQEIGAPTDISFATQTGIRERIEACLWWMGAFLAISNVGLFVIARRWAWAWRIATDDSWAQVPLRIVTLVLSHIARAQVWILDLYFQGRKITVEMPAPFLPLPLTRLDGAGASSETVLAPPWTKKHLWIQGNSGMGKTALFRHSTEAHFRETSTAFEAYEKWGCIVVAFSARDFAGEGEDKSDPKWVAEAVKATLSEGGLKFENDGLLGRILDSGTVAVAIDGLHEAGRTRAVEAFVRDFPAAPMLVTSQEPGGAQFSSWRLPADMRSFTDDLLKIYLGEPAAHVVIERITTSGLRAAIRSGYDVRLVIDLARADPANAPLPSDLIGLYLVVVQAGWPDATADIIRDQQNKTAAAAWRMVSERKPNEDKRRLKPEKDLPSQLLEALADAPERGRKPVRLVRRVGTAFEFVHDQMHSYLAARWFAQDGFDAPELEKMVAESTVWADTKSARETLWTFAAAMLDDERLRALWARVDDRDEWNILRIALKDEAKRRGLT